MKQSIKTSPQTQHDSTECRDTAISLNKTPCSSNRSFFLLCFCYYCSILIFCSIAAMGGGLVSDKKAQKETMKSAGRGGRMKETCLQKSQQGASIFFCLLKSCLHQPILLGKAAAAERRRSSEIETRDISTQYLISLPSLMHPGVSSPAQTQADR